MPKYDDFPFRAAGTLAIDLMEEKPDLAAGEAISVAWQAYKADRAGSRFSAERYSGEVEVAISGIRQGRLERVEPDPTVKLKARQQLGLS